MKPVHSYFISSISCRMITLFLLCSVLTGAEANSGVRAPLRDYTLCSFEEEGAEASLRTYRSEFSIFPQKAMKKGNHCLQWQIREGKKSWVALAVPTMDIRPYAVLRFRLNTDSKLTGSELEVCFSDRSKNCSSLFIGTLPEAWSSLSLPLGFMETQRSFDPEAVETVRWILHNPQECNLFLDDVELISGDEGDESWRSARNPKTDLSNPSFIFALDADKSQVRLSGKGKKSKAIEWSVSEKQEWARLTIRAFPEDIRTYRALSMMVMADRPVEEGEITLRFANSSMEYLYFQLPSLDKKWRKVNLPIPYFNRTSSVDPTRMKCLKMLSWNLEPMTMKIKKFELVKGKRGIHSWEPTESDRLARIFGEDRVKKVHEVETDHFTVLTDSKAVVGKFIQCLESHHDYVMNTLQLPPLKDKLPIYIFRSADDYRRFCVRTGVYTKEEAEDTAGHGSGRYFATYYMEPNSPVVVHELTHSLVYRSLGSDGGSWIHEGFAEYSEITFQNRDVAAEFSVNLRNREFTPLREFIAFQSLAFVDSKKDARKASKLYKQAAAFFAFLKKGPFADKFDEMAKSITSRHHGTEGEIKCLEKIYGMSLEDLEDQWVAWGKKRKRG